MSGETDLSILISSMKPMLDPQHYLFCAFPKLSIEDFAGTRPFALILEEEGLTVVLPADQARQLGVTDGFQMRRITLTVHSALEAVGLTAAVAKALTAEGIPANVIAAYYHDHVFVPDDQADAALRKLQDLSNDV